MRQCGPFASEKPVNHRIRTIWQTRTMSNALRIPSYRRHKPAGKAVVTIGGRDIYLGKYGSAESRQEFNRLIVEWTSHHGTLPK